MITLDYQTCNGRWGRSGMKFNDWNGYARVLGYLSNIQHYNNGSISMHIESNEMQGAYAKEGRIHFYGNLNFLETNLPDLYQHRSSGVGNVTCRINSNNYILSLINDYKFKVARRPNGQLTLDVFPPSSNPLNILISNLNASIQNNQFKLINEYNIGYNL